ncbi:MULTISPECIES: hypothetical protein [Methylibium]|uniref:MxaK protein n=1 Tax=Methylibium petroleiphilum (strain ATCC BAA-1232 / LMG 22953 / PM1) TaxID=420662 RepID=A2SKY8_METPP|nr:MULTISPECIES: hypothetical protein [Methylibium]ABM96227.1 hypothetical protein Mpe_A3274 [Methylibium petroleiphilum PM1]EWS52818.1 hypothetical protein X551_04392 [Methylibium sp. T29]EWS57523.1 hypothetical protein Y694_04493 [Methylibium sp. T29-B]
MRRLSVHGVFAAAAAVCAGVLLWQGLHWRQVVALNEAVAAAARPPAEKDAEKKDAPAPRDAPREVRLARAIALAQAGAHDAAFKSYSGLIQPGALDALGRQAQFNLGNMYLRQALAASPGGDAAAPSAETAPLIELAKQRYRDLLRADPGDWDARYNLERALRLAPEEQEAYAEDPNVPVERRRVQLRGMDPGDLP